MRVHLLSPYPDRIRPVVEAAGDQITPLDEADFLISYGHRERVLTPVLKQFENRAFNLHIGMLPWNRGADPNFWSWFDDSPKGVTIHLMDGGIDTGPIVAQHKAWRFTKNDTLATTYWRLQYELLSMFAAYWPQIRLGEFTATEQPKGGSRHRSIDKAALFAQLPDGWDTPVAEVASFGKRWRDGCVAA